MRILEQKIETKMTKQRKIIVKEAKRMGLCQLLLMKSLVTLITLCMFVREIAVLRQASRSLIVMEECLIGTFY